MNNVIYKSFAKNDGATGKSIENSGPAISAVFCAFGVVSGQIVGINQCNGEDGNSYLQIMIKSMDGGDHIVGTFDNTPVGRMNAEIATMAILRSLSVVI